MDVVPVTVTTPGVTPVTSAVRWFPELAISATLVSEETHVQLGSAVTGSTSGRIVYTSRTETVIVSGIETETGTISLCATENQQFSKSRSLSSSM